MDTKTVLSKYSIVIFAQIFAVWFSEACSMPICSSPMSSSQPAPPSPPAPAQRSVPAGPINDGVPKLDTTRPDVREYERLYAEVLKKKIEKEGLSVNVKAETQKKVVAFRRASEAERVKKLEDIKAKAKLYGIK